MLPGGFMSVDRRFMQNIILFLGMTLPSAALAQNGAVNFQVGFSGFVDCNRPIAMQNVPISGQGTGTLSADGNITADVTETAFILSTTIHFEGRLGRPTAAPGGTAQARVEGKHSLRLIWNLPNNQLITHISVAGQTCSADFQAKLSPGKTEYTLFDGSMYHYCGRPRVTGATCQVH
jgi:hypothetical protein